MEMLYLIGGAFFSLLVLISTYLAVQMIRQGRFFKIDKQIKTVNAFHASADPEYSEKILDLIHNIVNRIALIEFNRAIDGKDISKMHMNNFMPIIDQTAKRAREALKDGIGDYGVFSEKFIEDYIIDVSTMTFKSLLQKQIELEATDF